MVIFLLYSESTKRGDLARQRPFRILNLRPAQSLVAPLVDEAVVTPLTPDLPVDPMRSLTVDTWAVN